MTDSISNRLRTETAEAHHQAESNPLERALVAGTIPREQYADYLAQRFLIHAALDPLVQQVCDADARLAGLVPTELLQTPNLRADLAHLGVEAGEVSARVATGTLTREMKHGVASVPASVLGYYYVFEGSKNGARYISRALAAAWGLRPGGPGLRYLDPHGERQRPLWLEFKARLDSIEFRTEERDAMVAAARRTFELVSDLDTEIHTAPARDELTAAERL